MTAKNWRVDQPASDAAYAEWAPEEHEKVPLLDAIAAQNCKYGYRFAPLAMERFHLSCSLDILFLRRDAPGSVLGAGDIDNRIKTVIDALRSPNHQSQLARDDAVPRIGEDPFFCLLEDDKQVSSFSVETDRLLDPPTGDEVDDSKVRLIVTVELRPYIVTVFNMSFG